tara:strand:- start:67 stop:813 length:747 start_codon:yes stop_codon:yes gene_type:complete
MKISVITATWNSENTILDTIKSLRGQSYSNIEYIVIDGGSTDNTMKIIEQNKDIVDYAISERDAGIYDALNKGIAASSGDVLGFLHSDDIFAHRDVLRSVATAFSENKSDSVYGDLNYVAKNDTSRIVRKWRSGAFSRENMGNGWMPPHPTFYMKRALYKEHGFFDLNFKIAADYDSILRYLWKHRVTTAYIPEVLINMRVGGESNRSLKNIINKTREDVQAMKLNDLPIVRAILGKNFSKIPQFFVR